MNLAEILVATDFSAAADRAVETAVELARRGGGRVFILHVYELSSFVSKDAARDIERKLAALCRRFDDAGVPFTTAWRAGVAADEVVAFAREIGCELVVVGTHGRRGWDRFALGSVAERIVRMAPMPVLTVPSELPATASAHAGSGV